MVNVNGYWGTALNFQDFCGWVSDSVACVAGWPRYVL